MEKYTLIPSSFFDGAEARMMLSQVVKIEENDIVKHIELPHFKAVLVYAISPSSSEQKPNIYSLLNAAEKIPGHNKIVFEYAEGIVHIVLATPDSLLLANSYPATEFVTAEYFVFAALKEFSMNPEVTTLYYSGSLSYEEKESLFNYFQGVESISILKQ